MSLERLWAGWRSSYVSDPKTGSTDHGCVMCNLVAATDDEAALVLERTPLTITVMNLYPYGSGHLMITTTRHVPSFEDLDAAELLAVSAAQVARCGRSGPRTSPTASISASTSVGPRVPAFPIISTCTCSRVGAATRIS